MKVCVSATDGNLDADVDSRFGRCRYFVVVDVETMEYEAFRNEYAEGMGGVGIRAAQFVTERGVDALISSNIGPNALQALLAAGVKVFASPSGATVREAVEQFKRGELSELKAPTQKQQRGGVWE